MAKNSDIRLSTGWYRHPKVVKLRRRLGGDAVASLIQLWTYTGEERPSGILSQMDSEDIEIVSGWEGADGEFTETLVALRLLDISDGVYAVHDWSENNPWASGAEERSEIAKRNANARWKKDQLADNESDLMQNDASCMQTACKQHANCNAPFPSPSPLNPLTPFEGESDLIVSEAVKPKQNKPQKTTKFNIVDVPLPPALDSPEITVAWQRWCEHRSEIRKPLTKQAVLEQLSQGEAIGAARFLAALKHSTKNGYQGLFEPTPGAKSQAPPTDTKHHHPPIFKAKNEKIVKPSSEKITALLAAKGF